MIEFIANGLTEALIAYATMAVYVLPIIILIAIVGSVLERE